MVAFSGFVVGTEVSIVVVGVMAGKDEGAERTSATAIDAELKRVNCSSVMVDLMLKVDDATSDVVIVAMFE